MSTTHPKKGAPIVATARKNGKTDVLVAEDKFQPIVLKRLEKHIAEVPIIGVTPLIPHRWTEKSRRQMLDKHQGRVTPKKSPKNPEEEAVAATYWCEDGGPGIPATAFKSAIADAARFFDKSVSFEMLKRCIHVFGEGTDVLVRINGDITMREDTPRNTGGTPDLRYRNQIWPWSATLAIEFISTMLTHETLVTLVDAAGSNGVGDWRPSSPKSKTGTFGKFQVSESD